MHKLIENIIKMTVTGTAACIIIKFLPTEKLTKSNILLVSILIVLTYILSDKVCALANKETEGFDPKPANDHYNEQDYTPIDNQTCSSCEVSSLDINKVHSGDGRQGTTGPVIQDDGTVQEKKVPPMEEVKPVKKEIKDGYSDGTHLTNRKNGGYDAEEQSVRAGNGIIERNTGEMEGLLEERPLDPFNDYGYNDMKYSDYHHIPVASGYKTTDYEYGYSFIPPEKWYPKKQPLRPPMCITDRKAKVVPVYTDGAPLDMKEWYDSTRVTGPQGINVNYVRDRYNKNDNR